MTHPAYLTHCIGAFIEQAIGISPAIKLINNFPVEPFWGHFKSWTKDLKLQLYKGSF